MSESKLFTLVKKHSDDLAASVSSAETKFDEDPDLWLKVSIRSDLGPWIRRYSELYSDLGVSSHSNLMDLFKTAFNNHKVREVYEELLEAEESWTQFTTKVDRHLNQHRAQPLTEDQVIPHNISIKNIRNEAVGLHELVTSGGSSSGGDGVKFVHLVLLRHFA